ncbi:MAG: TPM domain-containing protein [Lachnospiraceae bacterium]|nr:TPM domain-containing protein [Lachnospiraceae bacterium]
MRRLRILLILTVLLLGFSLPVNVYADEVDGADDHEGTLTELPDWYPEDGSEFVPFHDEGAPRVTDAADIFSDDDEWEMEKRLYEIRSEIDKDIVIYTDVSSYGMDQSILAADFYDYNGYGCGDDYEGICLFICMDPDDRGWWAATYGPETKKLYTEEFANELDEALYEYMASGEYGEGVKDWIENIHTLYVKGRPFSPDWLPAAGEEVERFHDPDAPRIDDKAGVIFNDGIRSLEKKAADIAGKYDKDIVIHTTPSTYGMDIAEYAEKYYRYNGYGFGDDYDGILLVMVYKGLSTSSANISYYIYASGSGNDKMTETNYGRLNSYADDNIRLATPGKEAAGMSGWLSQVEHMERTGRISRSSLYWAWIAVFGSGCGAIFGGSKLKKAKKAMEIPALKGSADAYLIANSLKISGKDSFINSHTDRIYSPVKTDSGSSSSSSSGRSSGRSSYSSSYSGSSGRTHSGSGRKF